MLRGARTAGLLLSFTRTVTPVVQRGIKVMLFGQTPEKYGGHKSETSASLPSLVLPLPYCQLQRPSSLTLCLTAAPPPNPAKSSRRTARPCWRCFPLLPRLNWWGRRANNLSNGLFTEQVDLTSRRAQHCESQ